MVINLITSVVLKILCLKNLNQDKQDRQNRNIFEQYGLMTFRIITSISVIIGFSMITPQKNTIDSFLFFALVLSIMTIVLQYNYIKNRPNFHRFAMKCSNGTLDYKFIKAILFCFQYFEKIIFDILRFLFYLDIKYPKIPSPNKINVMLV